MKCVICKQGETSPGVATVTLERRATTLVFKQVPALVCDNCGEEYINEEVSRTLLGSAEEAVRAGVEVDVRFYRAA
jgi:YgiT-type zinc finger domain-containing protein